MRLHQIQATKEAQTRRGVIVGSAWDAKGGTIRILLRKRAVDADRNTVVLENKPYLGPGDSLLLAPIEKSKRRSDRSPNYVVLAFPEE